MRLRTERMSGVQLIRRKALEIPLPRATLEAFGWTAAAAVEAAVATAVEWMG
jgi:hypothetical protein